MGATGITTSLAETHRLSGAAAEKARGPEETEDLIFQIEDIKEEMSTSILMIEHDMNLVSKVSDRVLAMADGKVLTVGQSQEVQEHPEVIKAYLG